MPDTAAGLPIAPLPSATPSLRDPFPLRPLPSATPANCGPFRMPLYSFWLWRGGGRAVNVEQQSVLRGTACVVRQRLGLYGEGRHDGRAAVAGSARWAGPHGRRRLPGLQGGAGRMAGGGCRVCKVRLVAWRAVFVGSARENPGRAGRRTRLRINGGTV